MWPTRPTSAWQSVDGTYAVTQEEAQEYFDIRGHYGRIDEDPTAEFIITMK